MCTYVPTYLHAVCTYSDKPGRRGVVCVQRRQDPKNETRRLGVGHGPVDPWTVTLYTVGRHLGMYVLTIVLPLYLPPTCTSGVTELNHHHVGGLASSTIRERMCVWAAKRNKMKWHENEMWLGGLFVVCSALVVSSPRGLCQSIRPVVVLCDNASRVCGLAAAGGKAAGKWRGDVKRAAQVPAPVVS